MTPVSLTCPYCNSLVVMPRLPEADQRIRCPRCQELFPYHGQPGAEATGEARSGSGPSQAMLAAPGAAAVSGGRRLSNRALARIVVAVMALMAAVALLFAWHTTDERRLRDGQKGEPAAVPVVAPAKLTGLGYLPANVNFLAGFHVGELWDKSDTARRTLIALRENITGLQELENSTALRLMDIDHIVVGGNLLRLQVTIVVKTRAPYDQREVRAKLKAEDSSARGSTILYGFPAHTPLGKQTAYLWCADERTLVFYSHDPARSNDFPLAPEESLKRFPGSMQKALTEQITEVTQAWCLAQTEDLQRFYKSLTQFGVVPPDPNEEIRVLFGIHSLGAWIRVSGEEVIYHAQADCKDPTAAQKLDGVLAQKGFENEPPPFLEGMKTAGLLAKDLGASLRRGRQEDRVTLDARSSVKSLNEALNVRQGPAPRRRGAVSAQ